MICLFIDTSSKDLIVYLTKDNNVLFEKNISSINDHSSYLVPTIKEAFDSSKIDIKNLDKIIVSIGPGSFTGTRVGITVAKILAFALKIDVIPISSLEQYIYSLDGYDYYVPIIEDKNDKIYYSIYDKDKKLIVNDTYSTKNNLYDVLEKYVGNIVIISDSPYYTYETCKKKIDILNLLSHVQNRKGVSPHSLKPNYIKKIEVESKL